MSLNAANILATGSAIAHTVAEEGRAIATKAAAAAQWLMNAAMTANPIGLVIAAIALLVGGLITAYNHFEIVRTTVGFVWGGIKALVGVIADIVVAIANLDFSTVWDKIVEGIKRTIKNR